MPTKKYTSAFIIRTPYHYINALEAAERYGVEKERSVLIVWSNHFRERFSHMVEDRKWGNIEYINVVHHREGKKLRNTIVNIAKDAKYLIKANLLIRKIGKVKKCFSIIPTEKYVQHVINKLKSEKTIIIDEGVGVFELTSDYFKKEEIRERGKIYKYDRRRSKNYEFFTSYPIEEYVREVRKKEVKKHSFDILKSNFDLRKGNEEGGLILGTERNKKTKKVYPRFLRKSMRFMKGKTERVWYKPHRMETDKQINEVRKKYEVEIIKNDLPVEIALLREKIVPSFVSGFSSTAIHSIRKIFDRRVKKIKVFGIKSDCGGGKMACEYYEAMPDDQVDVSYLS